MNKKAKAWIYIATSLLVIGCIVFGGLMCMLKWDFSKLSTTKFESNTYLIREHFSEISVNTNTADVIIIPSEDNQCKVICYEEEKIKHKVTSHDGTLFIDTIDDRKWYEHICIHFQSPKITVYMPAGEYGDLSIKSNTGKVEIAKDFAFHNISIRENTGDIINYASATDSMKMKTTTGDIKVQNISAENIDLSVSTGAIQCQAIDCKNEFKVNVNTGDTKITDSKCGKFFSSGSTGDITLTNVTTTNTLSIERSTGNIKLDHSDASEMFAKTSTGDINGTLLSEKIFIVDSSTGRVSIPKTTTGGKCELLSDTGNIIIKINN